MVTSRIWFTAAQKAELWERWKNGQSAAAISRALERKNKTGVERIVVLHGGIGPAPRRRALAALRFEEREEISRGIAVGRSIRQIAQGLGRAPSTVSREIRRNGGSQAYRANRADRRARERALRLTAAAAFSTVRTRARSFIRSLSARSTAASRWSASALRLSASALRLSASAMMAFACAHASSTFAFLASALRQGAMVLVAGSGSFLIPVVFTLRRRNT